MPAPKKDVVAGGSTSGKGDNRTQNGNRSDFRTDTAISNKRFGNERTLQPWVPDPEDGFDGTLDKSTTKGWDQFAENERRFGLKSNYDESYYTTTIDKSHPQYRERLAAADRKAREIERSVAVTAHVAEERVMDYVGGGNAGDENEEDKYSGVRRQDFVPLTAGQGNKYTPPAKRAPTGQSNVKGAPIDPAIISSQIRAQPPKQETSPTPEQPLVSPAGSNANLNGIGAAKPDVPDAAETKAADDKPTEPKPSPSLSDTKTPSVKSADKLAVSGRSVGPGSRTLSPQAKETPSATSTVERDVLKEFKTFATQQRMNAEKVRSTKAKADKEIKLTELKKFATSFKLSTPVPTDLVSIIAKDPAKQKEIQAKAIKNAEDIATAVKTDSSPKEQTAVAKDTSAKPTDQPPTTPATDPRASRAPAGSHQTPSGPPNRHTGPRQQYVQPPYHAQGYRNNRNGPQHVPPQQQTGTLAQRLRNVEQQKFSQPPTGPQFAANQDMRSPPTGPSNNGGESSFNRRQSGVPGHMSAKLNPNSHEFKPSAFAAPFSPNGHVSASSSPRSAVNNVAEQSPAAAAGGQLIRRKTKAVDVSKCQILSRIQSIKPPQGRTWEENGGIKPPYDTLPTWRQLQNDEKPDSTMHITYKQFFERQPFAAPSMTTPNPPHVVPQLAHQHQLPFHLQHGASSSMGPRPSPHMAPMRMDTSQHNHGPHGPYGNDDHRMMHSNSAQSFASPRPGQAPVAYPGVNSPSQMPYNQPVFMGPGAPHMSQYRSFSNNPQYAPPQQGQMGAPMMMQPQYMSGPQGMMGGPQMMYPGTHPQFMPPAGPPQPVGANGYPSPGRAAAPMMVHQGSQQGHPMYGMSPNMPYSQSPYGMGQLGGPMVGMRAYNSVGSQQYGTSPQQEHQYGAQQRSGSSSYNKNYSPQSQNQGPPGPHRTPQAAGTQGRANGSSTDEAK